ncbi:MAG: tRNA epoxyqueuosine(34) reductase QueG [Exiguobacterium sp.]|uniref:tRNA epoxyqueuosine(34) reductase QueG n=1 Tax=Exiguobacterium alkaliphilum TaxID=1428684 RepID=A0ABT2L099_9BACL|nr:MULTISPECIES: tRNA epoxyqueuosine(34) reductase QueG [Exiguobacterium]MDX5322048.1 tRNA epoxyqueuosine(34) reductase QueG [Exiguobacterium sp.]MCT4796161.1 tRNA epoxyqueuosine(34) reductase QueG [Exiguobacterium alkaliphilum]MDX5423737.1 tRNA epoxyqueuosine(34) reductase QueG [Exiguobacterium sp.]MDX6771297.1 tRNA epoxyqueuosine(34) reductase QueG [Exiguobacterium sp.]QUE86087.1 tRNA epoxyqueuosine(34) reductase QueG [Exiguobacterium alkaliphilum]
MNGLSPETIKQKIVAYAETIGIDELKVTTADPFIVMKERLVKQQEKGFASGFEEPDLDKRTKPELLLEDAQSIIAIAIAYPSKLKEAPRSVSGSRRGLFARASWGLDYHRAVGSRLEKLQAYIESIVPGVRTRSMVDTGELVDRAVAERAGIGFSGKNCSIISPEKGSYLYLGEMILDTYLPPDEAIEDGCGDCDKCMTACPTSALVEPGVLDAKRCIAYLTQMKTLMPREFRSKLGGRLYGCDTCQQVCPYNRKKDWRHHEELLPEAEIVKPLLEPLLTLSNREFKTKFGHLSGAWRGKKPIQRNAILALAHYREPSAIPVLRTFIQEDAREDMRATAVWAIGAILGEEAETIYEEIEQTEQSEMVLEEIRIFREEWGREDRVV